MQLRIWGGGKMPANKVAVPPELRSKVSPALFTFVAEQRTFLKLFGTGLAVFALYGPIVKRPDHNGFRYLLGPWLCPSIVAIYYMVLPFRPYRGTRFSGRPRDIDTSD